MNRISPRSVLHPGGTFRAVSALKSTELSMSEDEIKSRCHPAVPRDRNDGLTLNQSFSLDCHVFWSQLGSMESELGGLKKACSEGNRLV